MILFAISILFLVSSIFAVFSDQQYTTENSIAVYWGQSSQKVTQKELGYYCQSSSVDIIILAFISVFGEKFQVEESEKDGFELNLSSFCSINEEGNHECFKVGEDIRKCQESGKKILISLGGEQTWKNGNATYGFSSDDEAKDFAHTLWNYFGEGEDNSHRPFGDATVDGFDIDAENEDQTGYLVMFQELKNLTQEEGSKKYLFSSAPQCNFPDRSNSELINGMELDYLFVQFYNNECQIDSEHYNYDVWSSHLLELGYETKVFIGLPSSESATENGFIKNTEFIIEKIDEINTNASLRSNFGGLMFWDASKGFDPTYRDSVDNSYIYKVWKDLDGVNDPTGAIVANDSIESPGDLSSSYKNSTEGLKAPQLVFILSFAVLLHILL